MIRGNRVLARRRVLIADMSNDTEVAHEKFDMGDQCWWQVVHRMRGFNFLDSTWTTIAADVIKF
jgi:hypothetical protein